MSGRLLGWGMSALGGRVESLSYGQCNGKNGRAPGQHGHCVRLGLSRRERCPMTAALRAPTAQEIVQLSVQRNPGKAGEARQVGRAAAAASPKSTSATPILVWSRARPTGAPPPPSAQSRSTSQPGPDGMPGTARSGGPGSGLGTEGTAADASMFCPRPASRGMLRENYEVLAEYRGDQRPYNAGLCKENQGSPAPMLRCMSCCLKRVMQACLPPK